MFLAVAHLGYSFCLQYCCKYLCRLALLSCPTTLIHHLLKPAWRSVKTVAWELWHACESIQVTALMVPLGQYRRHSPGSSVCVCVCAAAGW